MHGNVPVRFGRGRLDSLVTKGLAAYLIATQQSVLRNGLHTSAAQPGSGPRIGVPLSGGATGVGIIGPSCPDRAMRSLLRLRDWRSHPGAFERGQSRAVDI